MIVFKIENKSEKPIQYRDKCSGKMETLGSEESKLLHKIPENYEKLKEACIIEPIKKRIIEKEEEELEKQIKKGGKING